MQRATIRKDRGARAVSKRPRQRRDTTVPATIALPLNLARISTTTVMRPRLGCYCIVRQCSCRKKYVAVSSSVSVLVRLSPSSSHLLWRACCCFLESLIAKIESRISSQANEGAVCRWMPPEKV